MAQFETALSSSTSQSICRRVRVEVTVVNASTTGNELKQSDQDLDAIYEVLDRRYDTGVTDLAARHNEHQP